MLRTCYYFLNNCNSSEIEKEEFDSIFIPLFQFWGLSPAITSLLLTEDWNIQNKPYPKIILISSHFPGLASHVTRNALENTSILHASLHPFQQRQYRSELQFPCSCYDNCLCFQYFIFYKAMYVMYNVLKVKHL